MIFTHIDRYNMFVTYCQCNFNCGLAAVEYRNRFPQALQPNKTLFRKLATELKNNGSFLKKKTRMNSVTNNINKVNRVINYVRNKNAENLETSLREIQVACRINKTSARKILKKNGYRCYRAKKVHNLQAEDKPRRTTFCRWLLEKKRADPLICSKILWSDEANFSNNGFFNRNIHYKWTSENTHWHRPTGFQNRFSINVWLGILGTNLIGPYFYDGHLSGQRYLNFLRNEFNEFLDDLPLENRHNFEYFQQDGAPPHNSHICVDYLDEILPQHWIGTNGFIRWPPRSPDITPMDFFLWGYIKDKVFSTTPQNVEDLKARIQQACNTVTPEMLSNVLNAVPRRARLCIRNRGGHFEHLI